MAFKSFIISQHYIIFEMLLLFKLDYTTHFSPPLTHQNCVLFIDEVESFSHLNMKMC